MATCYTKVVALAVLVACAAAVAAEPAKIEPPRQAAPGFFVRADVDHVTRSYREGDTLRVSAVCEVDAYLYVMYQQSDGKTYQIFPNASQPENQVKAKKPVQIPAADDLFQWTVAAPFGAERVFVVASKTPLVKLSAPPLRKGRFNPVEPEDMKQAQAALTEQAAANWAVDAVEINTHPRNTKLTQSGARRFGVFFGVSQYEFDKETRAATEGKSGLNVTTCDSDARLASKVLREVGGLSDARVFVNDQATRANLEAAVAGWLPSVSRPGDTVLIFFSGHGGQIPDDNGDETDKMDEILVTHDCLSPLVLAELLKQKQRGELKPALAARVDAATALLRKAGSPERGAVELVRNSTVSDDLFGHWLQRLAGRQIIVILNMCHAGGFATLEKDLEPADFERSRFDFLDGELGRLKDIGQPESALLAACSANELAMTFPQKDSGVLTYYLLESVFQAKANLSLDDAYRHCQTSMERHFVELNAKLREAGKDPVRGHKPQFFNLSTRPVYLKP